MTTSSNNKIRNNLLLEIIPYEQPVKPDELIREIGLLVKKFVVLQQYNEIAVALWIVFTYFIDEVHVSPILAISSPEKQCGKSTLLSFLSKLVYKPLITANITAAPLFRLVDKYQPTMLIDEADTFIRGSEGMAGIINSGHTRDAAYVYRCQGDNHEETAFSTWCPKAIALIGKLPETLHDRSIVITLRRRLASEPIENLRRSKTDFDLIRRKLMRLANDYRDEIKHMEITPLDSISDRASDNWEPLLSIVHLTKSELWLNAATVTAQLLSARINDAPSIGTELLKDIYFIFQTIPADKISSARLISALSTLAESQWVTYNNGKPILQRQLASILKGYGINSKSVRIDGGTPKGYDLNQFKDAFERYLPTAPNIPASTPLRAV